jgi:hypothetical protein
MNVGFVFDIRRAAGRSTRFFKTGHYGTGHFGTWRPLGF